MKLILPNDLRLPNHLDSTMISCFRSCPNKYLREFVQGFRPPGVSIDLHAGGCFAHALEVVRKGVWENNLHLSDALERSHAAYLVEWGDFVIPEFKKTGKTMDRVWEAVVDYFAQYPPLTDHIRPYMTADGKPTFEYTFAIPLEPCITPEDAAQLLRDGGSLDGLFPTHPDGSPFLYTGRFDMLGEMSGRPVVEDDKTSGKTAGANWAEQWDLRSQFLGYVWACQQGGMELDTVVVRGISILKTLIGHAEAVKTYTPFMVSKWHEQLRRDVWRLRRCWDETYFDFNLGDACTSFGNCMFQTVCQSPNPETWLNEFVVRKWNPLDKNPIKTPETV